MMDANVLKIAGQIAGIGGLALGVVLLLLGPIVRRTLLSTLKPKHSFWLLVVVVAAVWSIGLAGIGAWVYVERKPGPKPPPERLADVELQVGTSRAIKGSIAEHLDFVAKQIRELYSLPVTPELSPKASVELKDKVVEIAWADLKGKLPVLLGYVEKNFNRAFPETPVAIYLGAKGIWAGMNGESCPYTGYNHVQ